VDLADLRWVLEVCKAKRQGSFARATHISEEFDLLLEVGPCAENLAFQIRSSQAQSLMRERAWRIEKSMTYVFSICPNVPTPRACKALAYS
jgi:hypothetical protein